MLVTEFMEAGDLWSAIQLYKGSGALSWYKRGRQIAIEVARGLHFLHRHKIIHFVSLHHLQHLYSLLFHRTVLSVCLLRILVFFVVGFHKSHACIADAHAQVVPFWKRFT